MILFSKVCVSIVATMLFVMPIATEPLPCKVPVFRYALEHWLPDPYEVAILHRGKLSEDEQALLDKIQNKVSDPDGFVNLKVVTVDVQQERQSELLTDVLGPDFQRSIVAPEIVLLYPAESQNRPLAWRGRLSDENIDALFDSPARNRITELILAGESVVWVLVGAGDAEKDEAAEKLLRSEIARLEKEIKMRDIEVIESEKQYGAQTKVELRLGIEMLVLDRDDPKEKVFASTLVNSEEDLAGLGEPFAIPVFGRGRAHLSLAGKGINPKMIETSCRFLIGDCSCEIKGLNPGVDLLFAVNWDDSIVGIAASDEPLPDLAGVGLYTDTIEGGESSPPTGPMDGRPLPEDRTLAPFTLFGQPVGASMIALAVVGVLVIALSAIALMKTAPK